MKLDIFQINLKLILFLYGLVVVSSITYFLMSDEKKVQSILYKFNYYQLVKFKREINMELIKSFNAY